MEENGGDTKAEGLASDALRGDLAKKGNAELNLILFLIQKIGYAIMRIRISSARLKYSWVHALYFTIKESQD